MIRCEPFVPCKRGSVSICELANPVRPVTRLSSPWNVLATLIHYYLNLILYHAQRATQQQTSKMATEVYRTFYKPKEVIEFLELGTDSFIGTVDETTILKYPKTPGDEIALTVLDLEA